MNSIYSLISQSFNQFENSIELTKYQLFRYQGMLQSLEVKFTKDKSFKIRTLKLLNYISVMKKFIKIYNAIKLNLHGF